MSKSSISKKKNSKNDKDDKDEPQTTHTLKDKKDQNLKNNQSEIDLKNLDNNNNKQNEEIHSFIQDNNLEEINKNSCHREMPDNNHDYKFIFKNMNKENANPNIPSKITQKYQREFPLENQAQNMIDKTIEKFTGKILQTDLLLYNIQADHKIEQTVQDFQGLSESFSIKTKISPSKNSNFERNEGNLINSSSEDVLKNSVKYNFSSQNTNSNSENGISKEASTNLLQSNFIKVFFKRMKN